jgi:hypothetical protein
LSRQHVYIACFALHFSLLALVSCRQTLSVMVQGNTVLPHSWDAGLMGAEALASTALGERLKASNLCRQAVAFYTNSAGIETGYGFFAPNVASTHKLVFEIRYPDGRVEYDLPRVGGAATGLRLTLLFDNIARARYELLRETMCKMMAFSVWRHHPGASLIRVVFGLVNPPSIADFERGQKESYEVLFAYDFTFPAPTDRENP